MSEQKHYVTLTIESGELHRGFVCESGPDATCRKRPPGWEDGGGDSWSSSEATETGFDCWAVEWIEAAGIEDGLLGADEILARVPVLIAYDEGVEITPMSDLSEQSDLDELERLARAQASGYARILELDGGIGKLGVEHPEMFDDMQAWSAGTGNEHADTVLALVARVREAEAERDEGWRVAAEQTRLERARAERAESVIAEALDVARSASVPLGVPEAMHYDRLLAETRRVLSTYEKGATQ